MITDTKWVKSITKNTKGKGHIILWHDDKKDYIFDTDWINMCVDAQKTQRALTYEKEKNDAGYWNITKLEFAEIDLEPQEPGEPIDYPDKEDLTSQTVTSKPTVKPTATEVKTTAKKQLSDRDKLIEYVRVTSMSLSYSKDANLKMMELGHIKAGDLQTCIKVMADDNVDWFMKKLKNYF